MSIIEEPKPAEPPVTVLYPALHGLHTRKKAELIELVKQMATDWRTLNALHNDTAQQRDWCSEYEDRQRRYNAQFEVLKLKGRADNRIVGLRSAGL
jgi:hypothetical protein